VSALPSTLRSHRATRRFFYVSVLVLVAGVIAILVTIFGRTASDTSAPAAPTPSAKHSPARPATRPRTVPLSAQARQATATFIKTAVVRKHLEQAWNVSGPGIRQGMTRRQFLSGNIAVVPITQPILQATIYKVDYSYADRAQVEVAVAYRQGKRTKIQVVFVGLKRLGKGTSAHWVVDTWQPWVPIPVRATP